jgi:integrase/recombinase XerD
VRTRAAAERSLPALFRAYLDELRVSGGDSLQERARHVLPRFFDQLREQRVRDVRAVTEEHLLAFARHLAGTLKKRDPKEPLGLGTQALYLGAVQRFFAFLERRGFVFRNPARDLPLPKEKRLPRRVLSESEARRLMNAPSRGDTLGQRDRVILELLYGAGLRRGECLRLDLGDLDLGQDLAFVRDGKGKKDRLVPLGGRATSALALYLRESRPQLVRTGAPQALLLSKYGGRLSAPRLDAILKKHAGAAGIKGAVFPHSLRHSYATHLLRGGASIRHVQELLGHKSLRATALYTRVDVEDLRQVLVRSHPRERAWRRRRRR